MPTVAHKVDALVRKRPGITSEELSNALGTDVDRALRRLVQVGYIRRVRSKGYASYFPIDRQRD
jgi:predicted transcriptional regulator